MGISQLHYLKKCIQKLPHNQQILPAETKMNINCVLVNVFLVLYYGSYILFRFNIKLLRLKKFKKLC